MDVLIVVDMQNDFVTGALGSSLAQKIVIPLKEYLNSLKEDTYVILARDTHDESYMESNEGLHLPIPHCLFNTWGWQIVDELKDFKYNRIINKYELIVVFCDGKRGNYGISRRFQKWINSRD